MRGSESIDAVRHYVRLYESFHQDPEGPPMMEPETLRQRHSQPDEGNDE